MGGRGRASGNCQTNFTQFPVWVAKQLFLIPHLDFEHFHKSSDLVQIISLYLTALFPWLLQGEVNQSLTAQNLAAIFTKDVDGGIGQA